MEDKVCSECGTHLTKMDKKAKNGATMWGCPNYPTCKGKIVFEEEPNQGNLKYETESSRMENIEALVSDCHRMLKKLSGEKDEFK